MVLNNYLLNRIFFPQINELKENLNESKKREENLSQELRSLTELLKESQQNVRSSNEKIHQLSVRILSYFHLLSSVTFCCCLFQYLFYKLSPFRSDISAKICRIEKGTRSAAERNRRKGGKSQDNQRKPYKITDVV